MDTYHNYVALSETDLWAQLWPFEYFLFGENAVSQGKDPMASCQFDGVIYQL